ncbi:MAG: NADH-quinone oxidoreductase subunit M [Coriobacteriia bacterium]|nr:NADH-quinone oxidoreductase subunit M [Coriobacteriia bacterium]
MLTLIVFLPLVGAILCAVVPKSQPTWPRWIAGIIAAVDLALVGWVITQFSRDGGLQFVEKFAWVPMANINYHLALDGLSLPMLFLSALLTLLAVIASWKLENKPAFYFAMLMLLQVGMNGVFLAMDFILFYVFWELVLVPMYFLIAQWGGERRQYAAMKFFLYTLLGSVFMLVGIIALYLKTNSFDIVWLQANAPALVPAGLQWWLFLAFFLGFAVKVPMWPLHTWLPDAHVEAPTAASVLLAGVLLKMGTYGFMRVSLPILPQAYLQWRGAIGILAAIAIVYGAAVAFAQTDLKKLVAYSSVSHMGFAMLGIAAGTAAGLDGAVAVNFSHGLTTGMLFFMVGMVYDRAHTREISKLSGLAGQMPVIAGLMAFASFASMGLPALSGFVGEFLSLLGAWQAWAGTPMQWAVAASSLGVLFGAAYMLWMLQRVVLGQPSYAIADLPDASLRDIVVIAPLVLLTVAVGVNWSLLLGYVDPAVRVLGKAVGI